MAKISDLLAQGRTISYEFFPPKTPVGIENLHRTVAELAPTDPSFMSVTYGAGGSTRDLTAELVIGMNAEHDFRYVTPGGLKAFEDREKAFAPGGAYAEVIARHPMFVKVGDDVFVHGGILPKHVSYGLDRMNDELDEWLVGKRKSPPSVVTAEARLLWPMRSAWSFRPRSKAMRRPCSCVPPSGVGMVLQ